MVGLLARAVAVGEFGGILFIIGFAALFGWQIGGFILRNKPRNYTFSDLPKELLP
jgi:membrane protein CcdC involved in cytochrome C biogenesis